MNNILAYITSLMDQQDRSNQNYLHLYIVQYYLSVVQYRYYFSTFHKKILTICVYLCNEVLHIVQIFDVKPIDKFVYLREIGTT